MLASPVVSRRRWILALLLAAAGLAPFHLAALPPGHSLEDRILAAVDNDPILASDVERVIALGLVEPSPDETDSALRRRVLEGLIEQRLRFHEVDRFGFGQVPVEEIEERCEEIRSRFPTEEAYRDHLRRLDMNEEDLRQLVARQLMILAYVEERLGARVFVGLEEIRAYYQEELVPAMEARGERPPPLETVREEIRTVIRERHLGEEVQRWTEELRRQADIVSHFDEHHDELPPVVETLRSPSP